MKKYILIAIPLVLCCFSKSSYATNVGFRIDGIADSKVIESGQSTIRGMKIYQNAQTIELIHDDLISYQGSMYYYMCQEGIKPSVNSCQMMSVMTPVLSGSKKLFKPIVGFSEGKIDNKYNIYIAIPDGKGNIKFYAQEDYKNNSFYLPSNAYKITIDEMNYGRSSLSGLNFTSEPQLMQFNIDAVRYSSPELLPSKPISFPVNVFDENFNLIVQLEANLSDVFGGKVLVEVPTIDRSKLTYGSYWIHVDFPFSSQAVAMNGSKYYFAENGAIMPMNIWNGFDVSIDLYSGHNLSRVNYHPIKDDVSVDIKGSVKLKSFKKISNIALYNLDDDRVLRRVTSELHSSLFEKYHATHDLNKMTVKIRNITIKSHDVSGVEIEKSNILQLDSASGAVTAEAVLNITYKLPPKEGILSGDSNKKTKLVEIIERSFELPLKVTYNFKNTPVN